MYLSKSGLSILVVGGMLLVVTFTLIAIGESVWIPQIWLAVAFIFGVAAVVWFVSNLAKKADIATMERAPREYIAQRRKFFEGYWALKIASNILKIGSIIVFCTTIFGWIALFLLQLFRFNRMSDFGGGIAIQSINFAAVAITVVSPILISCIFTYASGQLIDVILSMESSLKALADRRRQNNPPSSN